MYIVEVLNLLIHVLGLPIQNWRLFCYTCMLLGEYEQIGKQTEWKERLFGGGSGVRGKQVKIWFRLSASLMQRKRWGGQSPAAPPPPSNLHSLHLLLSFKLLLLFIPSFFSPRLLSVPAFPFLSSHVPVWQTDLLVTSYFFPILIKRRGGGADFCSD